MKFLKKHFDKIMIFACLLVGFVFGTFTNQPLPSFAQEYKAEWGGLAKVISIDKDTLVVLYQGEVLKTEGYGKNPTYKGFKKEENIYVYGVTISFQKIFYGYSKKVIKNTQK